MTDILVMQRAYRIGGGMRSDDLETFHVLSLLADQGLIDHIQVYVVPAPEEILNREIEEIATTDARIVVHAPHHLDGVNPADPSLGGTTSAAVGEAQIEAGMADAFEVADRLDASYIVAHAGYFGHLDRQTAVSNVRSFIDRYHDRRLLIENLPSVYKDLQFVGTTAEELKSLNLSRTGGVCLDFAHLYCTANYLSTPYGEMLAAFSTLPVRFHHLSNSKTGSIKDQHLPLDHPDGGVPIDQVMAWVRTHPANQTSLEYKNSDHSIYQQQLQVFDDLYRQA
ncbi:TIM barrel protein [Methanosphaerula subterraneus]|uniref:TIM barrel protein n=1 Tax=Methanosphaerula subterraneus TaxID=3350244 RepID=UPI003F862F81